MTPEDFVVEEVLGFDPPGEGAHHWIYLRCRERNTVEVARTLSKIAGLPVRDVGFSGLKDRHAVTTQSFRLPCNPPGSDLDASVLQAIEDSEGIDLVQLSANKRKIKRGIHAGNCFRIVARDLVGDRQVIEERLLEIRDTGVPNYFGAQRFGREGSNLSNAERLFGDGDRRLDRNTRSLALSAARSSLFNVVLSQRVDNLTWSRAVVGDVMQFDGSRASFRNDGTDNTLADRIARGEIHPTGPLWGSGPQPVTGDIAILEQQVASNMALFANGLVRFGLKQDRRALRLIAADLTWVFDASGSLTLQFELPRGAFATVFLRELMANV